MKLKWKLFALANYLLLFVYGFLFLGALRFTAEFVNPDEKLGSFTPFMISLFIIFFNCVFNLYIFHIYFPHKLLSRRKEILYLISTILFVAALILVLVSILQAYNEELNPDPEDDFAYVILSFFFLTLSLGLFVLICQLKIRKVIGKNSPHALSKQAKKEQFPN